MLYCYSYGFYKCITGCWVSYGGTNQSQFEICFMKLISKSRKNQLGNLDTACKLTIFALENQNTDPVILMNREKNTLFLFL